MIKRVNIKRFKRFQEVTFDLPGHIVIAGPNNTGKTTMLQAVAAWNFAWHQWKTLNDFNRRNGYSQKPVARQAFSSVPLRSFELLWKDRAYRGSIEIEVETEEGWSLAMELSANSTEQIYVRPKFETSPHTAQYKDLDVVFVPPMTGLSVEEPEYKPAKIEQLLGQAKPGDVLRNLLVMAHNDQPAWEALQQSILRLFGYEILPPDTSGPNIIAEFRVMPDGPRYDIAGGGSGFQQLLMLLAFLNTRKGSALLLDEPDAHLHWILQDSILGELRAVAAKSGSQLIIATHSEEIINSVDPSTVCILFDQPRLMTSAVERQVLVNALRVVSNTDIMASLNAKGVLFTEDYTDLEILKAWANRLKHPFAAVAPHDIFWKKMGGSDFARARQFYEAIALVKALPGLVLLDGDARAEIQAEPITGVGLQRVRWVRYEIENYLLHPETIKRYVVSLVGGEQAAGEHVRDLESYITENYPPAFLRDPFTNNPAWSNTKARESLLPPLLAAAGIRGIPYTRFYEIAEQMEPSEIHPEVLEKLDAIMQALSL